MSLFALTACLGGGDVKSSINDDTSIIVSVQVGTDGKLNYVGTGDMEGFSISAAAEELAGKTVYIEKSESSYSVDGYVSLSPVYTVSLAEKDSSVYLAKITLPYSANILASEGGAASDSIFCSLSGSSVTEFTTIHGSGSDVAAQATFPGSFFAGYKKQTADSSVSGIIKLNAVSYAAATAFFTDPSGRSIPETSRGTDHVQLGEKVIFDVDEIVFGETVTSYAWELLVKPTGSNASMSADGTTVSIVPDIVGVYIVGLSLNGLNGKTEYETKNIFALNYTYVASANKSMCVTACHDGSTSEPAPDKYGRDILRDITSMWSGSVHASAYNATVAASQNSTCYQCHTTGFRPDGAYPSANGYDDKLNWTTLVPSGGTHLQGVTCEACHGPNEGSTGTFNQKHYKNTSLSSNVCLTCHDYSGVSDHSFKYSDAHDKSHTLAGGNVARNAACFKCHTGEGMMGRLFNLDITPSNTETISGIGCSVCHDPHGETGLDSQIRVSGSYTLPTGTTTANVGNSKLCYYCHNAEVALPAVGSIPHNTQAEFMQGVGGYVYGQTLGFTKSVHVLQSVQCATCHMKENGKATHELDMHDNPTGRIVNCLGSNCHTTSPTYVDGHYEYDGRVAAVRAKMGQLKAAINAKAGESADAAVKASYTASTTTLTTALNRAAYNYNYLLMDRSGGFHNPGYATILLDLSLADLAAN